ncbi:hypothetical protein V6N13_070171 [Hibiscus sabdariffa]|uniref:Uncharacterized protein n=1 Tax=Hibiscus sabdariffa TaxID=183260 RepID=A0ABR2NB43_9ROSI
MPGSDRELAAGHAETDGLFRVTTVIPGTDESIIKLVQQLCKLVDRHEVQDTLPTCRMSIKIAANVAARRDVLDVVNIFYE